MAKRLYVGNLPYTITEDELTKLFSEFGSVSSVNIITDKYSGRSKGFGFVEMSADEEADKATSALNGKEFSQRTLVVNEARPFEERDGGGSGPRR